MSAEYKRLIYLAAETDTPSTIEKILELNRLLFKQDVDEISHGDLSLLDDLICVLHNTDNLVPENQQKIIDLQEAIRSRLNNSERI